MKPARCPNRSANRRPGNSVQNRLQLGRYTHPDLPQIMRGLPGPAYDRRRQPAGAQGVCRRPTQPHRTHLRGRWLCRPGRLGTCRATPTGVAPWPRQDRPSPTRCAIQQHVVRARASLHGCQVTAAVRRPQPTGADHLGTPGYPVKDAPRVGNRKPYPLGRRALRPTDGPSTHGAHAGHDRASRRKAH
jgi:hypothetical protein